MMEAKETKAKVTAVKIVPYPEIQDELRNLALKYENLVVTRETYDEAKNARLELRDKRYEIQNITKKNKSILNETKKTIEARAEELISLIRPREDEIDKKIKDIEAKIEEEKEKKRQEEERKRKEMIQKLSDVKSKFNIRMLNAVHLQEYVQLIGDLEYFISEFKDEDYGDFAPIARMDLSQLLSQAKNRLNQQKDRMFQDSFDLFNRTKNNYLKVFGEEPQTKRFNPNLISQANSDSFKEYIEDIKSETAKMLSLINKREEENERKERSSKENN